MSFEVGERDLLARIGRLQTKSGVLETPVLLPVINPAVQPISPRIMRENFGCTTVMTNAYIIKKHSEAKATESGVHRLLDFDGVVMTDSGAYQILIYGDVEASNNEIIHFQEQIETDIGTILDVPTGWGVSEEYARHTVEETLKRAKAFVKIKSRDDILWTGPVQGGTYLPLISKSAQAMRKLPFAIHALGSPTPVMEQYFFDTLVDMIMTAKQNLPLERPLHLFGAGHPFMFALAVALGCDLFDSAAYAIYAREDRYMTDTGTFRLKELGYFPCSCSTCSKSTPADVKQLPKPRREEFLARHNLNVSLAEIKRIKQAIVEGQLWEHLQMRAHGHPAILQAVKRLEKYKDYLEMQSPVSKPSGLFFYDSVDLVRPEIVRHGRRLSERYSPPDEAEVLLLLPQTRTRPFHKSREQARVVREIERVVTDRKGVIHICTYAAPFGVVPMEIDEAYPLSQHEVTVPLDSETINYVSEQVRHYVGLNHYRNVVLLFDVETWGNKVVLAVERECEKKKMALSVVKTDKPWNKSSLNSLIYAVRQAVGENK